MEYNNRIVIAFSDKNTEAKLREDIYSKLVAYTKITGYSLPEKLIIFATKVKAPDFKEYLDSSSNEELIRHYPPKKKYFERTFHYFNLLRNNTVVINNAKELKVTKIQSSRTDIIFPIDEQFYKPIQRLKKGLTIYRYLPDYEDVIKCSFLDAINDRLFASKSFYTKSEFVQRKKFLAGKTINIEAPDDYLIEVFKSKQLNKSLKEFIHDYYSDLFEKLYVNETIQYKTELLESVIVHLLTLQYQIIHPKKYAIETEEDIKFYLEFHNKPKGEKYPKRADPDYSIKMNRIQNVLKRFPFAKEFHGNFFIAVISGTEKTIPLKKYLYRYNQAKQKLDNFLTDRKVIEIIKGVDDDEIIYDMNYKYFLMKFIKQSFDHEIYKLIITKYPLIYNVFQEVPSLAIDLLVLKYMLTKKTYNPVKAVKEIIKLLRGILEVFSGNTDIFEALSKEFYPNTPPESLKTTWYRKKSLTTLEKSIYSEVSSIFN